MSTPNVPKKNRFVIIAKAKIRIITIALMLLIEIGLITTVIILSSVYDIKWLNVIYFLFELFSIVVAIPIIVNSRMDSSYKITWLAFMVVNSVIGATFYLLFANKKFSKKEMKKIRPTINALERTMDSKESKGLTSGNLIDPNSDLHTFASYIREHSFTDTYANTTTQYFPWGEDAFPVMLDRLKKAKHYIFLEYFIIQHGAFWNPIVEILIQKAKEGVDVRVLYDDLGCLSTLPVHYDEELRKQGIKCYKYSPLKPFIDIRMNNRDHRKIMVIDGHTGFTGGINIADEYINEIVRFGKWKDNAILLEGDGVFGLTNLFLSTWVRVSNQEKPINYADYLPSKYINETSIERKAKGFVSVYGSIPYTYETVGLNIYTMLCYKAKRYIDICTPYLILNKEMEDAISQAAKSGVRVRLLTPHIPDKKMVFELTKSYYFRLIKAGVEIYEYTPGFVHAKMFCVDGKMATVGTINLDYRSLFLHCENGCLLYETESIKDIEKDFNNTFKVSQRITREEMENQKLSKRILRVILRVFAPLM